MAMLNALRARPDLSDLLDWDDLLLAPPERDTAFHLLEEPQAAAFLSVYRQILADYEPDPQTRAFYIYRRYFEDIEGIVTWARAADIGEEGARRCVGFYDRTMQWLRPAVRAIGADA